MNGKRDKGAAVPEAAIVLGLLFLFLFAAMEMGGLFFNRAILINASREGARLGARFDVDVSDGYSYSPPTDAEVIQEVLAYSSAHLISFGTKTPPAVQVSPSWASRQAGGSGTALEVTVTQPFRFLVLPGLTRGIPLSLNLTARTRMRME